MKEHKKQLLKVFCTEIKYKISHSQLKVFCWETAHKQWSSGGPSSLSWQVLTVSRMLRKKRSQRLLKNNR